MKRKTSVTLSRDILVAIDRLAGPRGSRSAVIEQVLRSYVERQARISRDAEELERLNRGAERLNAEVADVLAFQAWPGE